MAGAYGFKALFEAMEEQKALQESQNELLDMACGVTEGCSALMDDIAISDIEETDFDEDDLEESDDEIEAGSDLAQIDHMLDKIVDEEDADEDEQLAALEEAVDATLLDE